MGKRILSVLSVSLLALILVMVPVMAGNAGDRSMTQEDCRSCHLVDGITSVGIHHTTELWEEYCLQCHLWDGNIKKVTDCKICHVDERRDHHRLPGNDCAHCHGGTDSGSTSSGPSARWHTDEVTGSCSDCHSVGNPANKQGNQYRRGR